MTKLYMIDCVSTYHIRYCVEAEDATQLGEIIRIINEGNHELIEFSQDYLGENVITSSHIKSENDYLEIFDKDNSYLKEWNDEQKLNLINKKETTFPEIV